MTDGQRIDDERPKVQETNGPVAVPLPAGLEEIAQDFTAMSPRDRLTLLLDFSDGLPELPERYVGHGELLERVDECQSPLFLVVEVERTQDAGSSDLAKASMHDGASQDATVHLFFQAPAEAPTTRGFAGILHEGLDGLTVGEVLAVPTMRHTVSGWARRSRRCDCEAWWRCSAGSNGR